MLDVIANYVENFHGEKTKIDGHDGYIQDNTVYFVLPKLHDEVIHYEQKTVSDFLIDQGLDNVVTPLLNFQGQITTQVNHTEYIVCSSNLKRDNRNILVDGQLMAILHKSGAEYPYEPQYLSSYGKWKDLWQNKIDSYEGIYLNKIKERPVTKYQRLFIDTFPYIIGLSENALQYLQETESERRYHEGDQGTIVFQRYANQLHKPYIWSHELTYDHPVRDIAEYLRPRLLDSDSRVDELNTFFTEYEKVRPLSIFGWRLLYARLLFPVHLFDLMEKGLSSTDTNEEMYRKYKQILEEQQNYEKNVRHLFSNIGIDANKLEIPELDW
ncbi:protein kinase family protein [Aquibacillus kalidii]|uniref:hypothetical protein n=1 Tax=Aquibacillus kalidii TaxID=2762597 RepID=UPI001644ED3D|nr:hypothetical protein [Aquibacillus kalidii]